MILLLATAAFAQKQTGYVRTVQKANKPAQFLKGVEIQTKENNNGAKSIEGGYYEIPVNVVNGKKGYTITSVNKAGYNLVDEKDLYRFQQYSIQPRDIVLISKVDEESQTKRLSEKIRKNIEAEYSKKLAEQKGNYKEIEQLNKDYEKQLADLPELVKKLVRLDYKNLTDSLDIAIAEAYEEGDFAKAVELINKKPDLKLRSEQNKKLKELVEKEKETIIHECEIKADYFWSHYQKDSALYYLELRLEQDPKNTGYLFEIGLYYYQYFSDYKKALYYFSAVLSIVEKDDVAYNDYWIESLIRIGDIYKAQGKFEIALEQYDKALDKWSNSLDDNNRSEIILGQIYNACGLVYIKLDKFDKALEYFNKDLEMLMANYGDNNPNIAACYNNIGLVYENQGKYNEAIESYDKALDIFINIYGEKDYGVATCYDNIGGVSSEKGYYDKSILYHNKALEIKKNIFGEKHPSVATSYNNLGCVYDRMGEYDKANDLYNQALKIRLAIYGENHPDVAISYDNIGAVYLYKGDYDNALKNFNKSLTIKKAVYGENHTTVAWTEDAIGSVCLNKMDYDDALKHYNKALKTRINIFGENHPSVAESYNNIGIVFRNQKKYDKAMENYKKALKVFVSIYGEIHEWVAEEYLEIGIIYDDKNEYDKALENYNSALSIFTKLYGSNHEYVKEIKKRIDYIKSL